MGRISLPLCGSSPAANDRSFCPSAQPDWAGSVVFGVIQGTVEEPRMTYLAQPVPVTDEVLALAAPVLPTEVFRFAAPCAEGACQHFDGAHCRLVSRVVKYLPAGDDILPPCTIRPSCRWWQEEGKSACKRCPQIVSHRFHPSEAIHAAADPNGQ